VVETAADPSSEKAAKVEVDKSRQTVQLFDKSNALIGFYPATPLFPTHPHIRVSFTHCTAAKRLLALRQTRASLRKGGLAIQAKSRPGKFRHRAP
jgi:hypothetical protein